MENKLLKKQIETADKLTDVFNEKFFSSLKETSDCKEKISSLREKSSSHRRINELRKATRKK